MEYNTKSEAQNSGYPIVFQNKNGTYSSRGDDPGLNRYAAWKGTVLIRKNATVRYSFVPNGEKWWERADTTMPLDRFIKEGHVNNYEYSRSTNPSFSITALDTEGYVTELALHMDPSY